MWKFWGGVGLEGRRFYRLVGSYGLDIRLFSHICCTTCGIAAGRCLKKLETLGMGSLRGLKVVKNRVPRGALPIQVSK